MITKIAIIGVPQDLGASRRGVDMGASAMRIAGLHKKLEDLGYEIKDYGNIHCHDIEQSDNINIDDNLNYLDHILDTCKHLKHMVAQALNEGFFPLVLGGDHSINIGTMAGMKKYHGGKTGIIWIDAHGDFNTSQTSSSGNIHGMPFAVITDRGDERLRAVGPSPSVIECNAVQVGARDLDQGEVDLFEASEVTVFTMSDIDKQGMHKIAHRAIEIATKNVDFLHISFDIDALDPESAPGTGTRVQGGLTYREAHLLMELVHDSGKLSSFEMVEVNPTLDIRNKTALLAVGLIASALGQKIA
ncbi:MAG: arginase [Candidatus Heimdallarchaeota archaeon]|nr:arginase [Candidatus Heimdallarchaeota archaeon]